MKRWLASSTAVLLWTAAQPALAHITRAGDAHGHASDVYGLLALAALMAGAAWLDRRTK